MGAVERRRPPHVRRLLRVTRGEEGGASTRSTPRPTATRSSVTGWGGAARLPRLGVCIPHRLRPRTRAAWRDACCTAPTSTGPCHASSTQSSCCATSPPTSARRGADPHPSRGACSTIFSPSRVAATLLDALPELVPMLEDTSPVRTEVAAPAPSLPRRSDAQELLLVGLTAGPWRTVFDNWAEMAERFGYRYELVGRDLAEPYVAHATKWRLPLDYFADLPRTQLVFHLDAADGFVCDVPAASLGAISRSGCRSSSAPSNATRSSRAWRLRREHGASGTQARSSVKQAWPPTRCATGTTSKTGSSSDGSAISARMTLHLRLPENRHKATLDHRRIIVQNIAASERRDEYDEHRLMLNRRPRRRVHLERALLRRQRPGLQRVRAPRTALLLTCSKRADGSACPTGEPRAGRRAVQRLALLRLRPRMLGRARSCGGAPCRA